jgi:hypothetical protein
MHEFLGSGAIISGVDVGGGGEALQGPPQQQHPYMAHGFEVPTVRSNKWVRPAVKPPPAHGAHTMSDVHEGAAAESGDDGAPPSAMDGGTAHDQQLSKVIVAFACEVHRHGSFQRIPSLRLDSTMVDDVYLFCSQAVRHQLSVDYL